MDFLTSVDFSFRQDKLELEEVLAKNRKCIRTKMEEKTFVSEAAAAEGILKNKVMDFGAVRGEVLLLLSPSLNKQDFLAL